MRYLKTVQDPESGYPLTEGRSFFSLVVPEAGVNIVMNPECADLIGYDAIGSASIEKKTDTQRRGVSSIKVSAGAMEGVYYLLPDKLPSNKHFTFSVDVKGPGQILIGFANASLTLLYGQILQFNAPKFWNRYAVSLLTPSGSFAQALYVKSIDGGVFYVDGFQCEAKPYATTFISGNLTAPFDTLPSGQIGYAWMGPPHRAMSYRSADVTNGGRIIPLSDLGLDVTDFMGLGFQKQELMTSRFAFRDHAGYLGTSLEDRQFTIGGILKSDGLANLMAKRGLLGTSIVGPERKPMVMQVQLFENEEPSSEVGEIECAYISGLEGTIGNLYQERVAINFQAWRPAIVVEGNRSTQLDIDLAETEEHIAVLFPDGLMDSIPQPETDDEPPVLLDITSNMVIATDGCLYVGCGAYLMRWNGAEWAEACEITQVIDPPDPIDRESIDIMRICLGPDGRIYIYVRHLTYANETNNFHNYDSVNAYDVAGKTLDTLATTQLTVTYHTHSIEGLSGWDATGQTIWMMKNVSKWKPGCIAMSGKHMHIYNTNMIVGGIQESANGQLVFYNTSTGKWENCLYSFGVVNNGTMYSSIWDFEYNGNGRLYICGNFMTSTDIDTGTLHLAYGEPPGSLNYSPLYWTRSVVFAYMQDDFGGVEGSEIRCLYYDESTNLMYVGGTFDRFLMRNTGDGSLISTSLSPAIATISLFGTYANSVAWGMQIENDFPCVRYIGKQSDNTIYIAGRFTAGFNSTSGNALEQVDAGGIILYDPKADTFSRSQLSSYDYGDGILAAVDDIVFSSPSNNWKSGYTSAPSVDFGEFDPLISSFTARPGTTGAVYVYAANSGWRTSGATEVAIRTGATAWPRFEIRGPCMMHSIVNSTTRRRIVIGREVGSGEVLIIDTLPGGSLIYSSVSGKIPPSESIDNCYPDFPLSPGTNRMVVVMDQYGVSASCHMMWREEFKSFDGLVRYAR